jgi:hypothetical protein
MASADPKPTTQHHGEDLIEAAPTGDGSESDYDPLDFDVESSNTSITSSIYKHSYDHGRR